MKIGAVIAEYNPFHNGHQYQLEYFRKSSHLDYILVIMSGNFTQRGTPAWMPKHLRAEMALKGGADLVLELPALYATGSASVFAEGAVAHLNALGCVDELCFGCETPKTISPSKNMDTHLNMLYKAADLILKEPEDFKTSLTNELCLGNSYPAARSAALKSYLSRPDLLSLPNNILALEYVVALKKSNASIRPVPITRLGPGYHSTDESHPFASATALRQFLDQGQFSGTIPGLSEESMAVIKANYGKKLPLNLNDFSSLFASAFIYASSELEQFTDINEDIRNRMKNHFKNYTDLDQFLMSVKNKSVTYSRLCRCCSHILTGQHTDLLSKAKDDGFAYYARVLGFKKEAAPLLTRLHQSSAIPLITKLSAYQELLSGNGLHMIENDIYASDIYRLCTQIKFGQPLNNEFSEKIVII